MRERLVPFVLVLSLCVVAPAAAQDVSLAGVVTDSTGGVLKGARVVLRDVASGREWSVDTAVDGRYSFRVEGSASYLLTAGREGFSAAARTVEVGEADLEVPVRLELGVLSDEVTVTAARAEREARQVPLRVESVSRQTLEKANPTSTGDAVAMAANVTPVGNGPFGVRPRLRGLDSTRLLVLVDGERLNTARQATDRTGAEVGLVSMESVEKLEVVNGAGTLLYGSDALAGAINVITHESSFSPERRLIYGANGFFSDNENGARGAVTLGSVGARHAIRAQVGAETFENYSAGSLSGGVEDTTPFFTSGALRRADTIDDAFGFAFRAFPDPFNAPYVRTSTEVPNSQAEGNFVNAVGRFAIDDRSSLRVRVQRRRMSDVGFPDFGAPYFFNATSLPHSRLDRVSARYEAQNLAPWFANLSATAYYQKTERLLENRLPVQFPAPTAGSFFPITVMRLDTLSRTEQRVSTPGVDLKAVLVPATGHIVTAGVMIYSDRSSDARTTTTQTSMVGRVALGARGPTATVFPAPIPLGAPTVSSPSRVPDARLRNVGVFAQDEWKISRDVTLVAGLRADRYDVSSDATTGYAASAVVATARPAIEPSTQPDPNGASYSRNALTGDVGLVFRPDAAVSPFVRYGRSYRHPNLEEMFFSGPATVATIVPNVKVGPETGNNFDAGVRFRAGRVSGGVFGFVNDYSDFIAQDLVVATAPSGPIAQARNFADVRISGLEASIDAPIVIGRGVLAIQASAALTRGTITAGVDPLDGSSLADSPADNITPSKFAITARYTEPRGRFFVEYGVRRQGEVTRVARTLLESPFLIAQDLLSLDAFTVHRAAAGVQLTNGRRRASLTFAVENLGDLYYREHFQFAPSRGRSFTVGLSVGAF